MGSEDSVRKVFFFGRGRDDACMLVVCGGLWVADADDDGDAVDDGRMDGCVDGCIDG